jgi:uncharacterized membrane protein
MEKSNTKFKTNFITGLVILLPLVLTAAIINFLVDFLTEPFVGLVSKALSHLSFTNNKILFLSQEKFTLYVSKVLVLLALVSITFFLGLFTRLFFMKSLFSLADTLLHKIPIVKTVYKTTQDIIKTLFVSDKNSFKYFLMSHQPVVSGVPRLTSNTPVLPNFILG